jgi:formate dehydrogenase subunit gamma
LNAASRARNLTVILATRGLRVQGLTSWSKKDAEEIIDAHGTTEGAAVPMLHALQQAFGFVHEDAVPLIAEALNLTRAEVHGIVTFYHDFRRAPPGRHVLKLCRAEACQSMGGDALAAHAQTRLRVEWGETAGDRSLTLEPVYCLGLCACAPAASLDGHPIGRLDRERLDAFLDGVRR